MKNLQAQREMELEHCYLDRTEWTERLAQKSQSGRKYIGTTHREAGAEFIDLRSSFRNMGKWKGSIVMRVE